MTSFIFMPNDPPPEEMDVKNSFEAPFHQEKENIEENSITKSLIMKRKNMSMSMSILSCNQEEGITFGSKFSNKREDKGQPDQTLKIGRTVKIDCSGPANIISSPGTLSNQYFPKLTNKVKEVKPEPVEKQISQFDLQPVPEVQNDPPQQANNEVKQVAEAQPVELKAAEIRFSSWEEQQEQESAIDKRFTIAFVLILVFLFLSIKNLTVRQFARESIIPAYNTFWMGLFQ